MQRGVIPEDTRVSNWNHCGGRAGEKKAPAFCRNSAGAFPDVYDTASRCTERRLIPSFRAVTRKELPEARSRRTSRGVAVRVFGRPSVLPRARAIASPAFVRSLRLMRSCFASVAATEIITSRNTPQESKYCSVKLRY